MKRDCATNPKTLRLRRLLNDAAHRRAAAAGMFSPQGDIIRLRDVIGILELLWQSTARNAQTGDLTPWDPADIAEAVDWDGEPDDLIQALLDCGGRGRPGYLERLTDDRLVVHDWPMHCEDAVHMAVARAHKRFWDGSQPRLSRLASAEKEEIANYYLMHPVSPSDGAQTSACNNPPPAGVHATPTSSSVGAACTPAPAAPSTPSAESTPPPAMRTPCARRAHKKHESESPKRTALPSPAIALPSPAPPQPQPPCAPAREADAPPPPAVEPAAAAAASESPAQTAQPPTAAAPSATVGVQTSACPPMPAEVPPEIDPDADDGVPDYPEGCDPSELVCLMQVAQATGHPIDYPITLGQVTKWEAEFPGLPVRMHLRKKETAWARLVKRQPIGDVIRYLHEMLASEYHAAGLDDVPRGSLQPRPNGTSPAQLLTANAGRASSDKPAARAAHYEAQPPRAPRSAASLDNEPDAASHALWDATLEELRKSVDPENFATWVATLRFLGCDDGVLRLQVPSEFNRVWLTRNFRERIASAWKHLHGQAVEIDFRVASTAADDPSDSTTDGPVPPDRPWPDGLWQGALTWLRKEDTPEDLSDLAQTLEPVGVIGRLQHAVFILSARSFADADTLWKRHRARLAEALQLASPLHARAGCAVEIRSPDAVAVPEA